MSASPRIREEDLHAFVDGETDAEVNAILSAHLAASPADAACVETWRGQNQLIRAAFAKIEQEPIPLSLSLMPVRNLRDEKFVRLVPIAPQAVTPDEPALKAMSSGDLAKLCAAISIAFAGGMMAAILTPRVTSPLSNFFPAESASINHDLADASLPSQTMAIATLRDPSTPEKAIPTASLSHDTANPAPALFKSLTALELSITGFRVAATDRDPALCLFMIAKSGEPLTLCLERRASQSDVGFRSTEAPPLRAIDWREKTGHYALAGQLSESAMLGWAERIHARIRTLD